MCISVNDISDWSVNFWTCFLWLFLGSAMHRWAVQPIAVLLTIWFYVGVSRPFWICRRWPGTVIHRGPCGTHVLGNTWYTQSETGINALLFSQIFTVFNGSTDVCMHAFKGVIGCDFKFSFLFGVLQADCAEFRVSCVCVCACAWERERQGHITARQLS